MITFPLFEIFIPLRPSSVSITLCALNDRFKKNYYFNSKEDAIAAWPKLQKDCGGLRCDTFIVMEVQHSINYDQLGNIVQSLLTPDWIQSVSQSYDPTFPISVVDSKICDNHGRHPYSLEIQFVSQKELSATMYYVRFSFKDILTGYNKLLRTND